MSVHCRPCPRAKFSSLVCHFDETWLLPTCQATRGKIEKEIQWPMYLSHGYQWPWIGATLVPWWYFFTGTCDFSINKSLWESRNQDTRSQGFFGTWPPQNETNHSPNVQAISLHLKNNNNNNNNKSHNSMIKYQFTSKKLSPNINKTDINKRHQNIRNKYQQQTSTYYRIPALSLNFQGSTRLRTDADALRGCQPRHKTRPPICVYWWLYVYVCMHACMHVCG